MSTEKKPKKPLDNSTKSNRHDFQPSFPDALHCVVCGFDRHHPWHS